MLKSCKIYTCASGALGLHLSRAPWDPYPWVSSIQKDSTSYEAGVRVGDCMLELNGQDVLGMKISEIAALLKSHWLNESSNYVTVVIWRNKCKSNNNSNSSSKSARTSDCFNAEHHDDGDDDEDAGDDDDDDEDEENNAHNINQQSLQKFATCLQHIAQLLECPVCLEVVKPPGWQCCNGHVLCNNCRSRSEKCPVCRVPLGPRGRCLLSDKLFTLLADSFPCDGVRSNNNSPKDRRKCSTEFHNQPNMAIVQRHQHQRQQHEKLEEQGVKKAKDFLLTSLRQRRRKISNCKASHQENNEVARASDMKEENEHPSMQKLAMYDTDAVVVARGSFKSNSNSNGNRNSKNRKSSSECSSEVATLQHFGLQRQKSTMQQCHCVTCFTSNGVPFVNDVTAPTTVTSAATTSLVSTALNKYVLRVPSPEQQGENMIQQQRRNEEKYQNYQCPTGKLCCLNVHVMPHALCAGTSVSTADCTFTAANNNNETATNNNFNLPVTNNNSSIAVAGATKGKMTQIALMTGHQHQLQHHQVNAFKLYKILKNEWDILAHLTEDHKLPVNQYYAEYGQRIFVQCSFLAHQQSISCLNLRGSDQRDSRVEKFFIACIPLTMPSPAPPANLEMAIFLYHINALANDNTTTSTTKSSLYDEVSNFDTIIENPITGIKWFGQAHPLTAHWSHIQEKQHFLRYRVRQNHLVAVSMNDAAVNSAADSDGGDDDAFVIVVKRKLEIIKTNH